MTLAFNRSYNLTVGKPVKVTYEINPDEFLEDSSISMLGADSVADYRTILEKDAVLIKDLQITTNIRSSSNNAGGSAGLTTITILNLSGENRVIVERVNNYVILTAGYVEDEELAMVFAGQVQSCYTERVGNNLVTTLVCAEGYTPNNCVRISHSFKPETTYGEVLEYLAASYANNGIPTGELVTNWTESNIYRRAYDPATDTDELITSAAKPQNFSQLPVLLKRPNSTPMVNGYSAIGYLHQVLANVCSQIGYVSYITNGRLFIHPKGFTQMAEEYEFKYELFKSIRSLEDNSTNSSIGQGIRGVKIHTFLDGRLDIDKRIKVLGGPFDGTYKIITAEHSLDYQNGAWDTIITCTAA